MAESNPPIAPPLGIPGYQHAGGYVYDETHRELSGDRAVKIYRAMGRYHPVMARWISLVRQSITGMEWGFSPADADDAGARDAADLLTSCMGDMSERSGVPSGWTSVLSDNITALPYGWALSEETLKRRRKSTSAYNDGKIGWAEIDLRAQTTRQRWDLTRDGGILGMFQLSPMDGEVRYIPLSKATLWRPQDDNGSPEGLSFLSAAFEPWRNQQRMLKIAGIGFERFLAGIPFMRLPSTILTGTDAASTAARNTYGEIGKRLRQDEQAFVAFPSDRDANGHYLYDLTLLSAGGEKPPDPLPLIQWYDLAIARALWIQFLLLGEKNGTQALSADMTDTFGGCIVGLADSLAECLQGQAVSRLCDVNGIPPDRRPRLVHSRLNKPSLSALGVFIRDTGLAVDDPAVQAALYRAADLPQPDSEKAPM